MYQIQYTVKLLKLTFIFLCMIALIGCNHIRGTYIGTDQSHFDKIIFTSNHTVELIFMGSVTEADYEKQGDRIKINTAMGTQILNIDAEGCLDGGFIMGKYCKK